MASFRSLPKKTQFAIIGGGIAGVSCAEQLIIEEPRADIILISASPVVKAVKNVTRLSERLVKFDVEEEPISSLVDRYSNCNVILASAEEINDETHEILLSNGEQIIYEKLCICSGAVPKLISKKNPFVLGIRDTETIEAFQKKLCNARRVVIVGNGGIATELAYEIENCEVIWAIKDKSVGATFFDAGAAKFFLPCLEAEKQKELVPCKRIKYKVQVDEHSKTPSVVGSALGPDWAVEVNMKGKTSKVRNVEVEYECEIEEILEKKPFLQKMYEEGDVWPVYVKLTNGKTYGCDFIISATGVVPRSVIRTKNKLDIDEDGGIKVNDQMETNISDIFAAGDVCTPCWQLSKHWFQMRLWTQARQMGAYAARCMAYEIRGETALMDICFDLFTHVTNFFGYKVVLLGLFNGQKLGIDYELMIRVSEGSEYVKVVLQNGKMQGAILIGETDLEETFENIILNNLDLSVYGEDLLNPHIDIEDYFD